MSIGAVIDAMINYYAGDPKRISHFLKVYGYAKAIGEQEMLPPNDQLILELAAIVHDIGIKLSEQKYHDSDGKHQESEGPSEAKRLLSCFKFPPEVIERVCWIVGHHHSYDQVQGLDFQILIEADMLVNIYEDNLDDQIIQTMRNKHFRSRTGTMFLEKLYLQPIDKK